MKLRRWQLVLTQQEPVYRRTPGARFWTRGAAERSEAVVNEEFERVAATAGRYGARTIATVERR